MNLPYEIILLFIATTLLTVYLFYRAAKNAGSATFTVIALISWLLLQALVASSGFYLITDTFPPRLLFVLFPPLLCIALLFLFPQGRNYIDRLSLSALTILHVVRIPVEIVLYLLFVNRAVPELMTFEGRNWDILSGITAPLVFYFAFVKHNLSKNVLLLWNVICLGLLINIVTNAVLSLPIPFQQFAFDQPNRAILYFPFVWLPGCIVPLVLLAHLASLRQLIRQKK